MAWDGREASSGDTGFPAYEGAAWALVHWMSKERPEGLARLRAALQRGIALDVAWSDAFPDVSLGAIDATVRAYLRSPDRRLWWVALESIPGLRPGSNRSARRSWPSFGGNSPRVRRNPSAPPGEPRASPSRRWLRLRCPGAKLPAPAEEPGSDHAGVPGPRTRCRTPSSPTCRSPRCPVEMLRAGSSCRAHSASPGRSRPGLGRC